MNALYIPFSMLAAISLLISACTALPSPSGREDGGVSKTAVYESMLGKSISDREVAEFVLSNDCSSADQFLLCENIGMALWTDSNQVVETVYLYVNTTDGFAPYRGELPFGLKFYDTMAAVEYKLDRQGVGNAGLPDAVSNPDRMHYRATYHQAEMTVIYNYPFPDEGATINSILISQ